MIETTTSGYRIYSDFGSYLGAALTIDDALQIARRGGMLSASYLLRWERGDCAAECPCPRCSLRAMATVRRPL